MKSVRRLLAGCAVALALMPIAALAVPKVVPLPVAASYPRGTIIIVNADRKLYYVLGDGRAIQYPVAVGKPDELWVGRTFVSEKKENPKKKGIRPAIRGRAAKK